MDVLLSMHHPILGGYCKFINVWKGPFICRISWPSSNRKNKYPANIIHIPRQLTRPWLTANINPREHGFVSKTQRLIPANINEFTVCFSYQNGVVSIVVVLVSSSVCTPPAVVVSFTTAARRKRGGGISSFSALPVSSLRTLCPCLSMTHGANKDRNSICNTWCLKFSQMITCTPFGFPTCLHTCRL